MGTENALAHAGVSDPSQHIITSVDQWVLPHMGLAIDLENFITHFRNEHGLDGQALVRHFLSVRDRYDEDCIVHHVLITDSFLFGGKKLDDFYYGVATHDGGCVVSTAHPIFSYDKAPVSNLITLAMHEVGHVLGLIRDPQRTNAVAYAKSGVHCTSSACVMRLGGYPGKTTRRLRHPAYCQYCLRGLQTFPF